MRQKNDDPSLVESRYDKNDMESAYLQYDEANGNPILVRKGSDKLEIQPFPNPCFSFSNFDVIKMTIRHSNKAKTTNTNMV